MKKILFLGLSALIASGLIGQKMPSDYFEEGVAYMEQEQRAEAIASFQYIIDHHPKNELYPRAFYNLGYSFYSDQQFAKAKAVFKAILVSSFNEKEELGGSIMADPYTNYRHRAAKLLHEVYFKTAVYDSALYYLGQADTVYPYLHFCGNGHAAADISMALSYAEVYEKLGDLSRAKQALLKTVFIDLADNSMVLEELERLFKQDPAKEELLTELDRALENIYSRTKSYNDREYIYYYFKFQGAELMADASSVERDNFVKEKVIAKIQATEFYGMVAGL